MKPTRFPLLTLLLVAQFLMFAPNALADGGSSGFDAAIDKVMKPAADVAEKIVFFSIGGIPIVLILLAGTAIFLTVYFKFINVRAFGIAIGTLRGKYTDPNAPGQITHFQALSAALSATVGLGNIAGVAVAIGLGGPGATFWMILMGLCGMTTKFTECTLGVLYRKIAPDGSTRGGAMYYLRDGLKEKGMPGLGKGLAIFFAIMCVFGALGAGNMFQANQAHEQFHNSFGFLEEGSHFGFVVAIMVALVIIGGIVAIARVTAFLVPFMCGTYLIAAMIVLGKNAAEIPGAFGIIVTEAFSGAAIGGAIIGVLIQGIKRAVFSNEAGVGSAPIAHSAVKTDKPASEGTVALLEPFIDTVVVCTMTALVIITTGLWDVKADVKTDDTKIYSEAAITGTVTAQLPEKERLRFTGETKVGYYQVSDPNDKGRKGWVEVGSIRLASAKADATKVFKGKSGSKQVGALKAGEKVLFTGKQKKQRVQVSSVDTKELAGWVEVGALDPATIQGEAPVLLAEASPDKEDSKPLKAGDIFVASASAPGWYQVKNFDDSKEGWIESHAINLREGWSGGIWLTSESFRTVIGWFPYVLAIAVFLFAFSTMISWSYYAEQAVIYLFGEHKGVILGYKVVFCLFVVIGAAASLENVLRLADALFFCMVIPNLIGLFILLPKVKEQLTSYLEHVRKVNNGDS